MQIKTKRDRKSDFLIPHINTEQPAASGSTRFKMVFTKNI